MLEVEYDTENPFSEELFGNGGGQAEVDRRLIGLIQMLQKYATFFANTITRFCALHMDILHLLMKAHQYSPKVHSDLLAYLKGMKETKESLENLNFVHSAKSCETCIDKLQAIIDGHRDDRTLGLLIQAMRNFHDTFRIDCSTELYFRVNREDTKYFKQCEFPQLLLDRFPEAGYDVSEAGKCYALERYSACVFHLLRASEIGLREVYAWIGFDWTTNPSWDAMLKKIAQYVERLDKEKEALSSNWRREKDHLNRIQLRITATKDALRNKTMHPEQRHTKDDAYDAIRATVGLLSEIKEYLP